MPKPRGIKVGPDYSKIKQTLNSSSLQKQDNNVYQAIAGLIEGARSLQGFIDDQFPQLDGTNSSLYDTVVGILAELVERNNSKYSVSLTNSVAQTIPDGVETKVTFDTVIFDDGLMFAADYVDPTNFSDIILNANAQYLITVRCFFGT